MTVEKTFLDEVLNWWYETRRGLIKELNAIPGSKFGYRPTLESRTLIELVQHVLEVSIISAEELTRDDTNYHRATLTQLIGIYAPNIGRQDTKEKLLDLLVEQYKDADRKYRQVGELYMMGLVERMDGTKATRISILVESIGHEMYHRGQVTVYERLNGLEPMLTQNIRASSAQSTLRVSEGSF